MADRSVMLTAARSRTTTPNSPEAFYQAPLPFGAGASARNKGLTSRTKDGEEIGTFSKTAGGRRDKGNEPGWQCPEAFYEPAAGVGLGVAGSHGVVRKEKRWIQFEDEHSPGPIYYTNLDSIKPNKRSPAFSKASRFGPEKSERRATPSDGLPPRSRAMTPGTSNTHPYQTPSFVSSIHSAVQQARDGFNSNKSAGFTFGGRMYTTAEKAAYEAEKRKQKDQSVRSSSPAQRKVKKDVSFDSDAGNRKAGGAEANLGPSTSSIMFGGTFPSSPEAEGTNEEDLQGHDRQGQESKDGVEQRQNSNANKKKVRPVLGGPKKDSGRLKVPEVTPGPGHFLSNKYKPQPSGQWSIGRRFRQKNGTETPGPGAYAYTKAFKSAKPNTSTFGRTGRDAPTMMPGGEIGSDSPGPMLYSQLRVHK